MFDFDAGKLIIVGVIALIFIPPKDLPRALRTAGQFIGKMRRMAAEFQGQFMDAMREADMADVRREAQKLAESARVDHGMNDVEQTMMAKPRIADDRAEAERHGPDAHGADFHGTDVHGSNVQGLDLHGFHDDEFEPKPADAPRTAPETNTPREPTAEPASHTA